MRTKVDWSSGSSLTYKNFCKNHPSIKISFADWRNIIYTFSDKFREHILETGERIKLPAGFGEFSINKRKGRKFILNKKGEQVIGLPVDYKKTREKGKVIYNFNFHTEGYIFRWLWFKRTVRFKHGSLWYFKPSRSTSRLLAHYLKVDKKYQDIYQEWIKLF